VGRKERKNREGGAISNRDNSKLKEQELRGREEGEDKDRNQKYARLNTEGNGGQTLFLQKKKFTTAILCSSFHKHSYTRCIN
jgi:hypothetical protein